ncbi:cyclic AMP-dependent transcription factor ATF-3-like [Ptychodera flava]|uniref:cyclic AMP-dependent transcription factor ATF-3-like n=1 Tax=Ptychodera flava TaxID=63121 RepID=UPI00396A600C
MNQDFNGEVRRFCSAVVKEKLRTAIKRRRQLRGLPDVHPEFKNPNEKCELNEEEIQRKRVRRERNRVAAEKCRQKRKEKEVTVQQEYETQESINKELKQTIKDLEEEKKMLARILQNHPDCKLRP